MSQLEVDKVIPQSGTTLTLGESGDTITIASGATFTPTLTAPIIDEINDNNGNEEIIFTTTASAVNELTIANAATGNAPEIAATGDDTDIDLKLTPKGAGNLVLDGIEFPNADGSANQVLQTNGSGVLSFATPVAGITEADQWRLTASLNFSGSITPITANLERSDTAGFNYIGTGMTESSGVFTFPSTGIWMIMIQVMVAGNGATANYASVHFQTTQNNSTYVSQVNQIVSGIESTGSYANGFGVSFFDVTDISTHKCKFAQDAENTTCQLYGNTTIQSTGFTFIRLGDT